MPTPKSQYLSPLGLLTVHEENGYICHLEWSEDAQQTLPTHAGLQAYFEKGTPFPKGLSYAFSQGTPFQQNVWRKLLDIPYGDTWTYGELAETLGSHARAIGGAVGANPIPIIIPCHRVMGTNGKLTGFSGRGGVQSKQWLLEHEQKWGKLTK